MVFPSKNIRGQGQVYVIGHKTVGPDLHLRLLCVLGQQIAIDLMIAVLEKDRLAPVSTLRHVVRQIWNHNSRRSGRPCKLKRKSGEIGRVPELPPNYPCETLSP